MNEEAWALIASAEGVILDFDGPVTALMPPPHNARAADEARRVLMDPDLPIEIVETTDHLAVLRYVMTNRPEQAEQVEVACTAAEIMCARASRPAPEAFPLVATAQRGGAGLAIASNNSTASVRAFCDRFRELRGIRIVAGRHLSMPLKPHPALVSQAQEGLGIAPERVVFVGDTVSDVIAGHRAGVKVVGLAKNPQRAEELQEAGADALLFRELST